MGPMGIFIEINYDLWLIYLLYGIMKLHVNNFWLKLVYLYALLIVLCIFCFCPTMMQNMLCDYTC
jgi:hypothetical protein